LFHAKKLYHRVTEHLEAHLWYLAALINCLLRLTEHKRSLADLVRRQGLQVRAQPLVRILFTEPLEAIHHNRMRMLLEGDVVSIEDV
jgi:hypothetical protein